MSEKLTSKKTIESNMLWRFADRWGSQAISFVIGIIIAKILDPEYYGVVTIVNACINIFSVFSDCGIGNSLIQKKDADDLDYSTAFIANLILCIITYICIYIAAPHIQKLYEIESLCILIRVSSISIIISAYKNIQHSYVAKNMIFKQYFFASLFGTIGAGIIGITMAIYGYGVWALVISNLFDTLVDTVICAIKVDWKPKLMFSFERLKKLFGFGIRILFVQLLDKIYSKLYQLVTGIYYSSSDLAFFDKGDNLSNKITNNIDYTIASVLFPAMSNIQNDKEELKKLSKRMLKINTYIIYPLLIGLAVTSKQVVILLYNEKWLNAVPFIQIFCVIRLMLPINTININMINSIGRSDLYLRRQIIIRSINVIFLLITVKYSVVAMAIGLLASSVIESIINIWPNNKHFSYGFFEQIKDILPNILISSIMGFVVYFLNNISMPNALLLLLQVFSGAIIYLVLSIITKNESFVFLINEIKNRM